MRVTRAVTVALTLLTMAAVAAPAHADMVPARPFAADSGDACGYGQTKGSLLWVTPGPLPAISVTISGVVVDRPVPQEVFGCRDDGYYSTVRFTAYSGRTVLGSQAVRADNGQVSYDFSLGSGRPELPVTQLTVQVCRDPLVTLPPSYCGKAVTYSPISVSSSSPLTPARPAGL